MGFDIFYFIGGVGDLCGGGDFLLGNDFDAVVDCYCCLVGDGFVFGCY